MAITVTTREEFASRIEQLWSETDFEKIGVIKDHMKDDQPTGEVFLNVFVPLPSAPITFGGETYYPSNGNIAVNAFKLAGAPRVREAKAKAATLDASALRSKLKAMPGTNGTTHVTAVSVK